MVAQPGRLQAAFTAGELDPLLHERTELKYFGTGADRMENVVAAPQGGFRWRGGLRDVGSVPLDAARLFAFTASDGSAYDLIFRPGQCLAWAATGQLQAFTVSGLTAVMLDALTAAQLLDTMLLFDRSLQTKRIKHAGPTAWTVDNAPYEDIPNYDYGGPIGGGAYTNAVPAKWEIELVGFTTGSTVFVLTVSKQDTVSLTYTNDPVAMATAMKDAIEDLPNVSPGIAVASTPGGSGAAAFDIIFSGAGNEGDGWAVSGRVINKTDAAVLAFKRTPGVAPGEPVMSADRGWPACGTFYSQRLLVGGFRSLPGAWLFSRIGEYYDFDERFEEANGPALVPMDVPGGERIERIIASRNLAIFTTKAEYWIAERGLSRTEPPNHVQSSQRGTRQGVPIVENEGALLFTNLTGGVVSEFRYTDVEGNFVSLDISLLGSHLVDGVRDMAIKRATVSSSGNQLAMVQTDGKARIATILREQDVTAFARVTSDGDFRAVSVNGRNEMMWLVDRPGGRRLERLEDSLLVDEALFFNYGAPVTTLTGLSQFNGRPIWVIAQNMVLGPFTPAGGSVNLPEEIQAGYCGTWSPPVVTTLPPPRDIGPNIVLKRPARIHSVQISVADTTSLAIAVNGGPLKAMPLHRYGVKANIPELLQPVTATIKLRGLRGFVDEPRLTISQLRPGRLTVRSVTIEAKL